MAAVPWKPLFWERNGDAFTLADLARGRLAAVVLDLSPLRGGENQHTFLVDGCVDKLSAASKFLALAISALGTVELLARRCMNSHDEAAVRARARPRSARNLAIRSYDRVSTARGHLGAAGRLYAAATAILHDAAEEERVLVVEAVQGAMQVLQQMLILGNSGAPIDDGPPPLLESGRPSVAAAAAPTSPMGAWSALGGAVPGTLLQVALSGALPEIEAAQAALLLGAEAVEKMSKGAAADDDMSKLYSHGFRALDAAHGAMSALLANQKEAQVTLLLCAPKVGLDRDGNEWASWEAARADTERHGRAALDHLWSASKHLDYVFAGVIAWRSPSSAGQEARQLMRRAVTDAGEARAAGDQLRHAAARQFLHTWNLLHH